MKRKFRNVIANEYNGSLHHVSNARRTNELQSQLFASLNAFGFRIVHFMRINLVYCIRCRASCSLTE